MDCNGKTAFNDLSNATTLGMTSIRAGSNPNDKTNLVEVSMDIGDDEDESIDFTEQYTINQTNMMVDYSMLPADKSQESCSDESQGAAGSATVDDITMDTPPVLGQQNSKYASQLLVNNMTHSVVVETSRQASQFADNTSAADITVTKKIDICATNMTYTLCEKSVNEPIAIYQDKNEPDVDENTGAIDRLRKANDTLFHTNVYVFKLFKAREISAKIVSYFISFVYKRRYL